MEKMRDEEIADLISLGGWLRGTRALTRLIAESYSSDRSELLNQPDLVSYFQKGIASMNAALRRHPRRADREPGPRGEAAREKVAHRRALRDRRPRFRRGSAAASVQPVPDRWA